MRQIILILMLVGIVPGAFSQDVKREITRVTDPFFAY